jgi:hypothetical protein
MTAQDHPTFKKPKDLDVKVWRYMNLAKFLWMLQKSALYFSRSDLMGDPFEGHYSRVTALSEDAFVAAQMFFFASSAILARIASWDIGR